MKFDDVSSEMLVAELLRRLGCDLESDGMRETPARYVNALFEWTRGMRSSVPAIKVFNGKNYNEMIFVGRIPIWSLCEHHIAPFWGVAHVGYIPQKDRIIGLSKIARVVEHYAKRITIQERITTQVADHLNNALDPLGVGVVIQCRHSCIESRGVCKSGTITETNALLNLFRSQTDVRMEFLSKIRGETL